MKQQLLIGIASIGMLISASAQAQNIFEALGETYNTNPTLQAERAYLRSIDENVAIAKSGYRPNIALVGSYRDIDNEDDNGDNGVKNKTMAAKFSQPLFNGFSTVNSVKSADQAVRAAQNNLYNVEQNVFLEASTAYLNYVRDSAIVELQKNNEKLLKKRLDETQQRFNVGEVTRTDVSQAKARYSQAMSDRIASEGALEASKAVYIKIIGSVPQNLDEPTAIIDFLPKSYDSALTLALKNNYSIRQAKHLYNAKGYEVYANTGALLPQLSFDASASKVKSENDNKLIGDNTTDNVEWGLNLSIPLYNSGESRARIRQSKHQKWQAQEIIQETERYVRASVSSAWEYLKANESKIRAIKDQVRANEIALDGVQKEEALGNRTILDVLDAYQELLNSNVNEVTARRDYYVSAMQLLLSMGKLTAKDLKLGVDLYDAKKIYKETKDKWLALE
ncbi:MAG: hypothetical protein E7019_03050 [Alphaproteobacteria bacterium]|nr:hypothetical protein [Alphaproteobacteria bacterium]